MSHGVCAWDAFGRAGFLDTGLPPCAQLSPIRVVTNVAAPHIKESDNAQHHVGRVAGRVAVNLAIGGGWFGAIASKPAPTVGVVV